MTNEQKAIQLSENRKNLLRRLSDAKGCLSKEIRVQHGPWEFDFKGKRLVSKDKGFTLQWSLRTFPKQPINYENQQTSIGIVILKKVKS